MAKRKFGSKSERQNESAGILSGFIPFIHQALLLIGALFLLFRRSRFGARDQPEKFTTEAIKLYNELNRASSF